MPFRLDAQGFTGRAKVQFTTAAWMPHRIYQACLAVGCPSNTVYVQHAVCAALARDLDLDLDDLLASLPTPRTASAVLLDPDHNVMSHPIRKGDNTGGTFKIGPANTVEEVR